MRTSFCACLIAFQLIGSRACAQNDHEAEVRALIDGWAMNLRGIVQYQIHEISQSEAVIPNTGISQVSVRSLVSLDRRDLAASVWCHQQVFSEQGAVDNYFGSVIVGGKTTRCLQDGAWVDLNSFKGRNAADNIVPRDIRHAGILWAQERKWESKDEPMNMMVNVADLTEIKDYTTSGGSASFTLVIPRKDGRRSELSFVFDLRNQLPTKVSVALSNAEGGMYPPYRRETIKWGEISKAWVPTQVIREEKRHARIEGGIGEVYVHRLNTSYRYTELNDLGAPVKADENIRDEGMIVKLLDELDKSEEFLTIND